MNNLQDHKFLYDNYILGTYGPMPLTLVKGIGTKVWDAAGNEYLDFMAGIAVNTLGHSHPNWVKAVQDQAAKLVHMSNLYRNEKQGVLAAKLVEKLDPGRIFFCNSGAEANELAIKTARLFGCAKANGEEEKIYTIITAWKSFHGRTFGGMAATPQDKIQNGFRPMLPGFVHAELNDLDGFAKLVDDRTAAIMIEPVQGESGIIPTDPAFLKGLRKLCDEKNLLLIADEVQTGIGRTGTYFGCEHSGIKPDVVTLAKGLGGGFPIGAVWIAEKHTSLFTPGSHGSTFGGTALACAAALSVMDTIESENLVSNAQKLGSWLIEELRKLGKQFPEQIIEVRGLGLHIGVSLRATPATVISALREKGLILVGAGTDTIRFMPPLNVSREETQTALKIFREYLEENQD